MLSLQMDRLFNEYTPWSTGEGRNPDDSQSSASLLNMVSKLVEDDSNYSLGPEEWVVM